MKHNNISIMGIQGEKSEQGTENLLEETENFINLVMEKVQESQRVPNNLDPKSTTPRHIIIKMARLKGKEKILTVAREKQVITYKGAPIGLSSDY